MFFTHFVVKILVIVVKILVIVGKIVVIVVINVIFINIYSSVLFASLLGGISSIAFDWSFFSAVLFCPAFFDTIMTIINIIIRIAMTGEYMATHLKSAKKNLSKPSIVLAKPSLISSQ